MDPAIAVPKTRRTELFKLIQVLKSHKTRKLCGFWIVSRAKKTNSKALFSQFSYVHFPFQARATPVNSTLPKWARKMGRDFAGDVANFGLYRLLSLCIHEVVASDLTLGELAHPKSVSGGFSSTSSWRSSRLVLSCWHSWADRPLRPSPPCNLL